MIRRPGTALRRYARDFDVCLIDTRGEGHLQAANEWRAACDSILGRIAK